MGSDPGTPTDIEIVGVVGDTRYESLRDDVPLTVYLCNEQIPGGGGGQWFMFARSGIRRMRLPDPRGCARDRAQPADPSMITLE